MPSTPEPAPSSRGRIRVVAQVLAVLLLVGMAAVALSWVLPPGAGALPSRTLPPRPRHRSHTDHAGFMKGPFADGPAVTRACTSCHPDTAGQVAHSVHFTWLGDAVQVPGAGGPAHEAPQRIGKRNLVNNFCLSVESNWPRCTSCHAGYGWRDEKFDFGNAGQVDCLVCHEQTGSYRKGLAGEVEKGVDLVAVAASVAWPTRDNCGTCHFAGGGGDAVKHGDLDGSLAFARERVDLHMGRLGFDCSDCHRTEKHRIAGRSMSVGVGQGERVACGDCHGSAPHREAQLNRHTAAVACATCHIPNMAIDEPTKMVWDWSTAGQDLPVKDAHRYMKEKGSFVYARGPAPEYHWFDGTVERYLKGDRVDVGGLRPPESVAGGNGNPVRGPMVDRVDVGGVVAINRPRGSIADGRSQIWPFKVHRGKQPFDVAKGYLLIAQTYGKGGYWSDFDWDKALRQGSQAAGLEYSGSFGFVPTEMYWPLTHMVQPGAKALSCTDCHGAEGRMDWQRLGYAGDPARWGGRARQGRLASSAGERGGRP